MFATAGKDKRHFNDIIYFCLFALLPKHYELWLVYELTVIRNFGLNTEHTTFDLYAAISFMGVRYKGIPDFLKHWPWIPVSAITFTGHSRSSAKLLVIDI